MMLAEMLNLKKWVTACAVVLALAATLAGQTAAPQTVAPTSRITQEISSASTVTLHGTVRSDLTAQNDLGLVEDGKQLKLYLVLQRGPDQQEALNNLLARQQQPTAQEYHKWLTPKQYGAQFGASQDDIAKITTWMQAQGLKVNGVMNNAMYISFTATAGQIREVFGTQLHYFNIQGGKHIGNVQEPRIPAAMAQVVSTIKGLSKVPPQMHHTKTHSISYDAATHKWHDLSPDAAAKPAYSDGSGDYAVTPQDYYTIYNVNPVFNGSNLGANATIAVIEESDIEYGTVDPSTSLATGGDVATFRTIFGVPGTLNMLVYHGYGTNSATTCSDPGIDPFNIGEEGEAALDAEWANALAPSATLIFMSCDDTVDNGIFTSLAALVDYNLADTMSMSYGETELSSYAAGDYAYLEPLYEQAASQGQSVIVSSGDSGSDVADQNTPNAATSGINVSVFATSANVTSAGGTDFSDYYDSLKSGPAQTTYWGANGPYYNDALKYVPETVWNDSCAGSILTVLEGDTGAGFCALGPNSAPVNGYVIAGSGGYSAVNFGTTASPSNKVPAYQSGITGYPTSGPQERAQPDISMFASNGWWGHWLIFCDSYAATTDPYASNVPCTVGGVATPSTFGAAGGTSFVAPALAGVSGLLVSTGGRQGLLNPTLYALGKAQFTASATKTACYSNGQTGNTGVTTGVPASSCIFNDVTTGNNDVPCAAGSLNCYVNSGKAYGMLSTTNASSLTVAYPATAGYDLATGIGTLNVANLIGKWNTAFTSTTALVASPTAIAPSQSTTLTATVAGGAPANSTYTPIPSGSINFTEGATALGSCTLSGASCSITVTGVQLGNGTDSIGATFVGSATYPTSTSKLVTVTVAPVATTTTASVSPTAEQLNGTVTLSAVVLSTGTGTPTGTVTFLVGSKTAGTATLVNGTGTATGVAVSTTNGFSVGTDSITASYGGDTNFKASTSSATTLTVTPLPPATTTVTVSPNSVMQGASVTITATVTEGGPVPPGTVSITVGSHSITATGTLTNGVYTTTLPTTAANGFTTGTDTITATYSGDVAFSGTSGTASLAVISAATTTTLTTPTTVALGSSTTTLTYTATVAGGGATPTGTVAFQVGTVTVGTGTLSNGTASVTGITPTTAHGFTTGNDTVTATYTPAAGILYTASTGTATETVTAPAYTITAAPSSVSLAKSGSASVVVTLASTTYADTTSWTAVSSSGQITVTPTSGTATLGAGGSSTINLTITASGSAANHAPRMPWTGGMIAFGVVLAGVPLARRRKRVAAVLLTALAISTLGFMMSCGGSTGPRNYTVTVTGTGGISSVIPVTVK
jgi:subtilase family serine protease